MTIFSFRRTYVLGSLVAVGALAAPAAATYPGHSGRLAFWAVTDDGSAQVFTVRSNGDDLRQITHVEGDAAQPDVSPDGRTVVFEIERDHEPFCSVALVSIGGGPVTDLTGDRNGCEVQPSFTPDGRRIVFERYDDVTDVDAIVSMDLAGGDRHQITTGTAGVTDPNVSPGGRTVSYIDYDGLDLGQALATVPIDGGSSTQLVPFSFDVAIKQDWSPNGGRIVFTDNADNFDKPANVAAVRPDGTGLRYLTDLRSTETRAYVGGYSPDGNWIVFRLEDHGAYSLVRMRATGGAWHTILPPSTTFRPRGTDWGSR
jgi:Tol biopolymer transport system component